LNIQSTFNLREKIGLAILTKRNVRRKMQRREQGFRFKIELYNLMPRLIETLQNFFGTWIEHKRY